MIIMLMSFITSMGVPTLFRWLRDRYPRMMQKMDKIPPIDNFYIDMNGMIHPCFHPAERDQPQSEQEVFQEIFIYLDRLIQMVNPQKLLYMAIDGTAPLAKLNQQRQRRYVGAYESQYNKYIKSQDDNTSNKTKPAVLDSNQITPGTPFMRRLTSALKIYIASRQSTILKDVKIIFSDSITPGEGEHKIMHFIRSQRQQPGYNPNTSHCIHGLDGDLIMLALVSHEPNFYILREQVIFERNMAVCSKCGEMIGKDSPHAESCPNVPNPDDTYPIVNGKNFHFMSVKLFREYLLRDFQCRDDDLERVLDDFVFLCFMSGNDFLPHLHAMKITDNAILRIIDVYQRVLLPNRRFITDSGKVDFYVLLEYLTEFAKIEEKILVISEDTSVRICDNIKLRKIQDLEAELAMQTDDNKILQIQKKIDQLQYYDLMEAMIIDRNEYYKNMNTDDVCTMAVHYEYRKFSFKNQNWRQEYYKGASQNEIDEMCYQFLRGMYWVCNYYCNELIDWDYIYQFSEPPLLQDLCRYLRSQMTKCQTIKDSFNKASKPFSPWEQLLAVLPPCSSDGVPAEFRQLMLSKDSPLRSFYVNRFTVDVTGKSQLYQGTALLPGIDKPLLKQEFLKIFSQLPQEIQKLNQFKNHEIFTSINKIGDKKLFQAINNKDDISDVKIREKDSQKFYTIKCNASLVQQFGQQISGQYLQTSLSFMEPGQHFNISFNNLGNDENDKLAPTGNLDIIYDTLTFPSHQRWNNYVNETIHVNYFDFALNKDFKNYIRLFSQQQKNNYNELQITDAEWERDEIKRNNSRNRIYKDIYTNDEINSMMQKTQLKLMQYNPQIRHQQQRQPYMNNNQQYNYGGFRQQYQPMQQRNYGFKH